MLVLILYSIFVVPRETNLHIYIKIYIYIYSTS